MIGTVEQGFKVDVIASITGDTHESLGGWTRGRFSPGARWKLITSMTNRTEKDMKQNISSWKRMCPRYNLKDYVHGFFIYNILKLPLFKLNPSGQNHNYV